MSSIRLYVLAAALSLAPFASALAIEVLPMDTTPADCNERSNEVAAVERIESDSYPSTAVIATPSDRAESPSGIESGENAAPPPRSAPPTSVAPSAPGKTISRWNAFLPGMVR